MKDKPLIKYEELTDEQKAWVKDYINDDRRASATMAAANLLTSQKIWQETV